MQQREVPRSVRIGRGGAGWHRARLVVLRQRIEATLRAKRRRAAARARPAATSPGCCVRESSGTATGARRRARSPVEIGVERIRQLARAARRVERVGRAIERGRYSRTKCSHAASSPAAQAQASARSSRCSDFRYRSTSNSVVPVFTAAAARSTLVCSAAANRASVTDHRPACAWRWSRAIKSSAM